MKTVLVETKKKFLGLVYPHANDLNEHKSYARSSNQNKPKFMVAILRSQYLKDVENLVIEAKLLHFLLVH